MNNENEIERMESIIIKHPLESHSSATELSEQGIDDKKQAVKEFASNIIDLLDEMGMERSSEYNDGYDDGVADCITNIKSRLTKLYGADDK